MQNEYESLSTLNWRQRIVWPNLCYNLLILGLLVTTLTLSAVTFSRVEEETTCRLRYEGNENDVTEEQLQTLAKGAGWTLTHPQSPDCNRCPQNNRFPVWMAPVDICRRFDLSDTHPLCNENMNLDISHVKVCATQTQIDEAWADGGCQYQNGNRTTPHVAWDGALFCSEYIPECTTSYGDVQHLLDDGVCGISSKHNKRYEAMDDGHVKIELDYWYWGYYTYHVGCTSNSGKQFGAYPTVLQSPSTSYVKVRCLSLPRLYKVNENFDLKDSNGLEDGYDWWYASLANFPITTHNDNGNKVQKTLSDWRDPNNLPFLYFDVNYTCHKHSLTVETDEYVLHPRHGKPVSVHRVRCSCCN